uniref:Protein-serine/threonine phosphatase n=1 Tax=Helicotheca tamesis TaxID=374047 RepID=A0A7S2I1G1_9STRA
MSCDGNKSQDVPWAWVKRVRDLTKLEYYPDVSLPVEILPWLLLSDERTAQDTSKLKDLGVTHVLTMNGMPAAQRDWLKDKIQGAGIVHKYVSSEDSEGYDMIGKHWDECKEFLETVRGAGGRVVVHCAAGINRSGLIVCAAQMVLERQHVLDVVSHCVKRRVFILSNMSFQKQLCILAKKEGLLGAKPEGYTDDELNDVPFLMPPPQEALGRMF